jgi:NitT/TauT family transport system permease protein
VAGGVLWELVARWLNDPLFLVPPTTVVIHGAEMVAGGQLLPHVWASLAEFALGMVLACLVGVVLGLAIAVSRRFDDFTIGWIAALYATPIVALAPLVILWFGITLASKVFVVFAVAVFPVLVNTAEGIRSTDPHLIEAARAFNANRRQIFTRVMIPFALPFIFAGFRLAVGRGLIGVVVGEFFGANVGLGYLIFQASSRFDMPSLFVAVSVLALMGVILTTLANWTTERLTPWKRA